MYINLIILTGLEKHSNVEKYNFFSSAQYICSNEKCWCLLAELTETDITTKRLLSQTFYRYTRKFSPSSVCGWLQALAATERLKGDFDGRTDNWFKGFR